ncbi:NACHT domain-containing protein [Streptomyces sp. DSM 44917]|uniref:NACHT domain-containing protein n=1 Tax=Streptomyces boetiae TaxID=3075541 RepID=A0ABU2LG91_9ACTN|nr:NACHT domain-containing protein [Streptomyces sp. DSM 44917]MDT0310608.1 NACHT domain-containing protein [Streptomyces sp. DSM 44917]
MAVLVLGTALVLVVVRSGTGDVDPAGALVGAAGLAAGVWAVVLGVQARGWQDSDTAGLADRLAAVVLEAETAVWRGLLGGSDRTIDVPFVHRPAPAHEAAGAAPSGTLREVAGYYRSLRPGRLVVTGAPGAGKTVLALHLMLLLLQDRAPGDPVPVRLPLPGFDPAQHKPDRALAEWVAARLATDYGLRPAAAAALVAARKVLPVLDGLDEMDTDPRPGYRSRAAAALRAMNAYQQGTAKGQLIVTCRTAPYAALEALRVWAHDAARIDIVSLGAGAAWDFLTGRVTDTSRWEGVLDRLAADPAGPLAQGLSTPWRLTLAATVYEQREPATGVHPRHPGELLDPALDTPDKVRDHLLGLFIPAATAIHPAPDGTAHNPEHVRAWLTTLARYLNTNATTGRTLSGRALPGTDILQHELWPLTGGHRARVIAAAVTGAIPMAAGVAAAAATAEPSAAASAALIPVLWALVSWLTVWPEPGTLDLRRLRTPADRHDLVFRLAFGLMLGLMLGVTFGFILGVTLGLAVGFPSGLASGLAYGLGYGLAFGLMAGFTRPGTVGAVSAKDVLRKAHVFGLAFGLAFGFVSGFAVGFVSGFAVGLAAGLATGLAAGLAAGSVSVRYVVLLWLARRGSGRWLPWRLGRFLEWCCQAGLMRTAGIAYQFRHRELQDFLARTAP